MGRIDPDLFVCSRGTPIGEDVGAGSFMFYGCSPGPGVGDSFAHRDPLGGHEHVCCPHLSATGLFTDADSGLALFVIPMPR